MSEMPAQQGLTRTKAGRWPKGVSGNPKGTPKPFHSAVRNCVNHFEEQGLGEEELEKIARSRKERPSRKLAAIRLLTGEEFGDLADFESFLSGVDDLKSLRKKGINTRVVKKIKEKVRTIPGADGVPITEIERELELRDRAAEAFRDIMDYTGGKPAQAVNVDARQTVVRELYISFQPPEATDEPKYDPIAMDATSKPAGASVGGIQPPSPPPALPKATNGHI